MNALTISLILVALGSLSLVLRDPRLLLGAGAVQWLGLALASMADAQGDVRFSRGGEIELVTALISIAVLAVTLRSAAGRSGSARTPLTMREYALLALAILLVGAAGLIFASVFPLNGVATLDTAFYWAALSGAAALALQGTRDGVRLALGLFALLNCAVLLIQTLSITPPGAGLIALMALCRLSLALAVAYGWNWLAATYGSLSLDPLFAAPAQPASMELIVSDIPAETRALVAAGASSEDDESTGEEAE
jgi:hypothetical protein